MKDHIYFQLAQVIDNNQVSLVAGSNGAKLVQPEMLSRIYCSQLNRPHRFKAEGNRLPHHRIQVTIIQEVDGAAVIDNKHAPFIGFISHQRQQRLQILLR
ncbi:MAG: hypothetical protein A2Z28_04995 [Chloroflexi bacterium RBG_16_51_9]|nr:MAG: hypothetical protein A2Z28_04995 [Chloroflexi bacterium RBG_16_51_9]